MATFEKLTLSASSGGRPTKIGATSSAGTLLHTTGNSATDIDEIWLYACNTATTEVKLTVEFGGTTSTDDIIELFLPPEGGLALIVPGLILSGTGSAGRSVRAFASTTNVINVVGYVNRIS
jgi:hypothetical protein